MAHDTDPAGKNPKKPDDEFETFELPDFPDIEPDLPDPTAELDALPDFVPTADAASASGELPIPDALEAYDPVAPASGWLEVPSALPGEEYTDPSHAIESSDIFAGGPIARATPIDHSDVLSATAGSARATPPSYPQSGDGDEDLPLAEEVDIEESSLFPQAKGDYDDERPNFGASPPMTTDASSILAGLSDAEINFDASGVRLDAPGMERTLTDEPVPEDYRDSTAVEPVPRKLFPNTPASSSDWKQQSGSNLFSDARTVSDDDEVDPFTADKSDQPSLSSAQSSIFSGGKTPGAGEISGGSDPIRALGTPDAVNFSDHPDDEDSSILGVPPGDDDIRTVVGDGGGIDFNLPKRGRRDQPSGIDSGNVDWTSSDQDSPSIVGKIEPGDEWIVADDMRTGTTPVPDNRPPKVTAKAKGKLAPTPATPAKTKARNLSDPSVVVDFVSQSAEESAVGMDKSTPKKARAGKGGGGKGGWLGGGLVGALAGVGTCAGLYFGGVLGNKPATTGGPTAGVVANGSGSRTAEPPVTSAAPTVADAKRALASGDPAAALKALETAETPEAKGTRGQARFLVRVRDAAAIAPDDAELKQARADLQAAVDDPAASASPEAERAAVKAAVHLGLTHELGGNRAEAKKVYEAAAQKFPKAADVFQAALDRLSATDADAGKTSLLPRDAEQLALAAVFLLTFTQDAPADGEDTPEAGGLFWKAMNAATAGKYIDALEAIGKAKAAHAKRAKALAGRGLNPLSDPLEQIFPKCCDDLKAYWELRAAVYDHKTVGPLVKKDGVAKTFDQLAAAQKQAAEAVTLAADLKSATADLKTAGEKLTLAEKDLKTEQDKAKALADDVKKADDARLASEATVAAMVKELQTGKFLPEKFEPAAVLPAQKTAITRAGLTAADLVKLGDRVKTAEAEAKTATEKLATETKRLQTELAEGTKKLTDDAAAAMKKLTDDQTAAMKKLTDAHAVEIKKFTDNPIADKLKGEHAAEVKKLTDAHAAAMKKATDDAVADMKKLADASAEKVKALEGAVAAEKDKLAVMTKKFEADLGNAISPTQALDVWLPLLNTARRPADADPALAVAAKVTATAPKDSEDAAKAMVVSGLALQIKGSVSSAKGMFAAARQNPTYAPTKEWARIADVALGRIDDASGGGVVNPMRTNPAAAARALDSGITAYKAGRYADAVTKLSEATANDATNALSWYFLGAARWQNGDRDVAASDFRTGAEKEANRTVSAKTIDASLSPIQGPVRDALTGARP